MVIAENQPPEIDLINGLEEPFEFKVARLNVDFPAVASDDFVSASTPLTWRVSTINSSPPAPPPLFSWLREGLRLRTQPRTTMSTSDKHSIATREGTSEREHN